MFKVSYTIKNDNGYLVDKSKTFDAFQEGIAFVRELNNNSKLVGKPVIERS